MVSDAQKQYSVFLSVIIPAFNEVERRLEATLCEISEYLQKQPYQSEIIVVNDGSTDDTVRTVKRIMEKIPNLRLVTGMKNQGKGWAVQKGMYEARGERRLFMDADNATSIDHVEKVFPWMNEGYEVVIGSRSVKGTVITERQPLYKEWLGKLGNVITRICVLEEIRDTQCGFKCMTKNAAQAIFARTKIHRAGFDIEMLVLAKKLGYNIKEVPIRWHDDARTRFRWYDYLKTLWEVIKIRWWLWSGEYDINV